MLLMYEFQVMEGPSSSSSNSNVGGSSGRNQSQAGRNYSSRRHSILPGSKEGLSDRSESLAHFYQFARFFWFKTIEPPFLSVTREGLFLEDRRGFQPRQSTLSGSELISLKLLKFDTARWKKSRWWSDLTLCRYGLSDEAIAKVAAAKAGKKDSSGQIVGKIRQTVSSGIQSASTGVKNATETGRKQLLTLHKTQTLYVVHFWFIQWSDS